MSYKSQITYNDDGGSGNNFRINYDLVQGQTYYFGCRYYSSSSSGSYTVTLTLNSVLETLNPVEGAATVIDTMEGYIYGINPYITNPFDYFIVNNGYVCDYVSSQKDSSENDCFGTGTKFTVKSGETSVAKYTLIILGDVNGDGWYDSMDSIIVNCLANGLLSREQVGEAVYMAADCNHDDVIDEADVALLEQAGIILASVDQTKTEAELMTDSTYVEYLNLIDQNPT